VILGVLDASALLALLFEEPGADRVRAVIADAAMSTVNLAEVVGYLARKGTTEADIRSMTADIRVALVSFDEELAYTTGLYLPATRTAGLSLGDRACLALADRLAVRAQTTDRSWSRIAAAVGVEVEVIR
jgi:ribonuclease VapC